MQSIPPSAAEPAVRARHMKVFVAALSGLDPAVRERIFARVPADTLSLIEEAVPAVWLPMNLNVTITEATSSELEPRAARKFFREMALVEYDSDTFKSFVASIGRLLGLGPATWVKMAPKGWELVFKNCGGLRCLEREDVRARLEYTNIPNMCLQGDLWIESLRSSFYSAFDLTGVSGEVSWDELDYTERRAVFAFAWG